MNLSLFVAVFAGYLIGSIPFTQMVARWRKGIDLREVGSRNVGGMNAMRNVGWGWGLLAGTADFFKGIATLVVARALGAPDPLYLLAGLAALAGHNYPIWLGFRGGKGIAVGLGVALWAAPLETVIGFLAGLGLLVWTKNVTIAGGVAFLLMIGLTFPLVHAPKATWLIAGILALMVVGILPEAIRLLRTPGGIREYFRDPIKVYRKTERNSGN